MGPGGGGVQNVSEHTDGMGRQAGSERTVSDVQPEGGGAHPRPAVVPALGPPPLSQGEMFPTFRVHCFWLSCGHVVDDDDPVRAHDRMEDHYEKEHQADMARAGY